MALTSLISFGIEDADGDRKTLPVYVPATATISDLTAAVAELAPLVDAAIDGKVVDASVTFVVALPGGLKSAAVAGSEVQRGALLRFDAQNTNYSYSMFIPTWEDAGFAGNSVVNTGDYATLITKLFANIAATSVPYTDRYGNDLVAYLEGYKTFRK